MENNFEYHELFCTMKHKVRKSISVTKIFEKRRIFAAKKKAPVPKKFANRYVFSFISKKTTVFQYPVLSPFTANTCWILLGMESLRDFR